ncbi:hypothetical protein Taro_009695 [Colocasia esculenta]|uniref:Uncharacterized protein n=1 Tax=Colocasia esculenta TaxID=4460 RepID=A0A843U159_COLES|nr:hypothetical protein [Colocasia esculenta]
MKYPSSMESPSIGQGLTLFSLSTHTCLSRGTSLVHSSLGLSLGLSLGSSLGLEESGPSQPRIHKEKGYSVDEGLGVYLLDFDEEDERGDLGSEEEDPVSSYVDGTKRLCVEPSCSRVFGVIVLRRQTVSTFTALISCLAVL